MSASVTLLIVTVILLGGLFFFGLGVEALNRYSSNKLRDLLRQRPAESRAGVSKRLEREDDLLSAALVWLTLVELTLVAVLAALLRASTQWGFGVCLAGAVAVAAAAMVLIRRGMAGALAAHRAEEILVALLPALAGMAVVMRPLAAVERFVIMVVSRLMGESESPSPEQSIQEEILSAVDEGEREGVVAGEQAEMIESIFGLRELDVREVMTPRTDLVWLSADATLRQAARVVQDSGHSRIPVFSGSRDNVVGILYAKDLLAPLGEPDGGNEKVTEVVRRPLFVPETKPVWQLLQEFRGGERHVAIVVDEYGGTAGLVTVEDILEEVVGEITDEYDRGEPPPLKRLSETAAEVDARMRVDELNSELGTHIAEHEDYDTVGGLAFDALGHVPAVGERFRVDDVDFTILEAGSHRVGRVRVEVHHEESDK